MYTTSTDFKTVINNPSRKFECKVVCGSKTYTNVNIANINITGSLQPSGYTIGSAISQKATFKFINDGNVTFPSNTISLQIGLLVNGSYEYIPIGSYTMDSHDSDDYTITVIAYDNMIKLENKYNGSATTLRALAQEVCSACGVTLADSGSIPTTTITAPTSGKYTCRELMGYIVGCCCGNAVIDRTGALKVQKLNLSTINKQVTTDNWFTYKNQDMIFSIEQLICDTGGSEKLTSGSTSDTDKQLTIKNPLMTQGILDGVKTELSGVIFTGFDIKYQGDISTDLGDTIKITDRKGQTLTAPLLNRTINYNGGLTENIKTEGKKKVDVASSYYSSGRYALELDKFNFDIKGFNSQLGDFSTNINNINSDLQNTKEQIIMLNGDNIVFDGEFQNYSDPAKLPEGATIPYTKTDWDEYPLIYQHDIYYTNGINYNLDNWFTDMFGRKAYTWLQTGGIDGNGCFHANIPVSNYKVGFRLFPRTRYLNIPDDATKLYISLYIKALGEETYTDTDGSVYNRRENFKISFQLWLICCPPGVNYKKLSADERVEYDKKYFKVIYTPEIAQMNAWQHSKVAIDLPPLADRAGNKFWFYIEMSDGNGTFEKRCEWDLDKLWMTTNGEIKYKTSPEELNEKIDKKLDGTFATSTDIQALFS